MLTPTKQCVAPHGHGIAKIRHNGYGLTKKDISMTTIMPQGELVRKAAAYLAEQRSLQPGKSLATLLDEAGMRFNLTPLDAAALERLFRDEQAKAN
mgnify:CR=1 FL=1